ncbi:hypothetical protein [Pseudomonas subflava]|uniref:hypothetical protein n=1 Tax=Pseudomonas subflava TaxID=2952933 RepID=UPI00207ADB2F|nr:hypothetical protein [Pseudomonas subflava]
MSNSELTCTVTERGFPLISLDDYYGQTCSLQISSLVEPRCCWFGVDAPHVHFVDSGEFAFDPLSE